MKPLKWRHEWLSPHSPFIARRTAEGYWPGWEYRLDKYRANEWRTSFRDTSPLSNNQDWRVIGRGNFVQAKTAAIAHHNHK